jgi:hypothetical protein
VFDDLLVNKPGYPTREQKRAYIDECWISLARDLRRWLHMSKSDVMRATGVDLNEAQAANKRGESTSHMRKTVWNLFGVIEKKDEGNCDIAAFRKVITEHSRYCQSYKLCSECPFTFPPIRGVRKCFLRKPPYQLIVTGVSVCSERLLLIREFCVNVDCHKCPIKSYSVPGGCSCETLVPEMLEKTVDRARKPAAALTPKVEEDETDE